jgi:hypothetical protein
VFSLFSYFLLLLNMHNFPSLVRTRMFYGSLSYLLPFLTLNFVKLLIVVVLLEELNDL